MIIGMQTEILDGQSSGLFSNEPFEKRPVMTIEDFVLHSDDDFRVSSSQNPQWSSNLYKCGEVEILEKTLGT